MSLYFKSVFKIVLLLSIVGLVVLLSISLYFFHQSALTTRELQKTQQARLQQEPKYQEAQRIHADFVIKRTVLAELKGWTTSRVNWHVSLDDLCRLFPGGVQMTRLAVRMEGEPIFTGEQSDQLTQVFKNYTVLLDGSVNAPGGDETILSLEQAINEAPSWKDIIKTSKLKGVFSQPHETGLNFRIEITTRPREI